MQILRTHTQFVKDVLTKKIKTELFRWMYVFFFGDKSGWVFVSGCLSTLINRLVYPTILHVEFSHWLLPHHHRFAL